MLMPNEVGGSKWHANATAIIRLPGPILGADPLKPLLARGKIADDPQQPFGPRNCSVPLCKEQSLPITPRAK
jgi:hypothetical protein